ncbi:signal peptidase, endoplasmic reticulum-type [Evansella caseinilytica]|uniref:Signal peptidase I n=1 Tax=Evansella caseinilytica TaxID=1503961 RepID=A0A1H3TV88_9BACI|nr:signal peptidase I [Evansella caseinilytica]SDZ53997.1 signal peptidase, endoplasmic reticulum-type [Evansella caseinilytica]
MIRKGPIVVTFFLILFTVVLGTTALVKASDEKQKVFHNYQLFIVQSGSMEPAIKTGSIIAVKSKTNYQVGDIITYRSSEQPNTLITHRIVEVVEEGGTHFITKGDKNENADSLPVSQDNIIGSYTNFTIPYAGYALQFSNSNAGTVIFFIIPGVLMVMFALAHLYQEIVLLKRERA